MDCGPSTATHHPPEFHIPVPSNPCGDGNYEVRMVVFGHGEDFFSASNSGLMIVHAASGH
ncbi:hypothetical protein MUK42_36869 [Musa troglodytarum]|uniref:Uncharacterized protein n=1 Tax=Musa troglodytarum TaxID=320322 RepID=A0A9E7ED61_9LILI|nr:hypothetical protein MUK42_36869 [Musa troglodytarum]